jgi:predicted phage terminase large subunit-like protein
MEGGLFKPEWFEASDSVPQMVAKCRYWDLAASTTTKADYSCGALVGKDAKGVYWILDLRRIRARPADVERLVQQTAELDGHGTRIWMECEPGSAGLGIISHYTRNILAGHSFHGDRVTGSKQLRAEPLAAMAEQGNVKMRRSPWNHELLQELSVFPAGQHDDAVDSVAGAYGKVSKRSAAPTSRPQCFGGVRCVSPFGGAFGMGALTEFPNPFQRK